MLDKILTGLNHVKQCGVFQLYSADSLKAISSFCTIPFRYDIIQSSLFKTIFLSVDLSTCFCIYCSSWITLTHTHTHTPFKLESKQKEKDKCPTISILTNENIVDSLKPTTKWFILQKALDSAISLLPNKMCLLALSFFFLSIWPLTPLDPE